MYFSTVSDGQGKGSCVLRLSKCLLSSLLFHPSWDSWFYSAGRGLFKSCGGGACLFSAVCVHCSTLTDSETFSPASAEEIY